MGRPRVETTTLHTSPCPCPSLWSGTCHSVWGSRVQLHWPKASPFAISFSENALISDYHEKGSLCSQLDAPCTKGLSWPSPLKWPRKDDVTGPGHKGAKQKCESAPSKVGSREDTIGRVRVKVTLYPEETVSMQNSDSSWGKNSASHWVRLLFLLNPERTTINIIK